MEASTHLFERVGGRPELDFVNSVGGSRVGKPREYLRSPADVLAWLRQTHFATEGQVEALSVWAAGHPREAERSMERLREFREALFRLLLAFATGEPANPKDLAALEREAQRAWAGRRLVPLGRTYRWADPEALTFDAFIPRLALSTSELLTTPARERLRVCEATVDDGCGWLFVDGTKNRSRRWCSMKSCGNLHKARRHCARTRAK